MYGCLLLLMAGWSITISTDMLLSLWMGLILLVLSFVVLVAGSLPDNPPAPLGDAMRWIFWSMLFVWIAARVLT